MGQVTDYDKLTLEVWTDGSISPDDAVSLAGKILTEHLTLFVGLTDKGGDTDIMVEKDDVSSDKTLDMPIEELDLSVRSYNCLKRAGINTVGELCSPYRGRDDEGTQSGTQVSGRGCREADWSWPVVCAGRLRGRQHFRRRRGTKWHIGSSIEDICESQSHVSQPCDGFVHV